MIKKVLFALIILLVLNLIAWFIGRYIGLRLANKDIQRMNDEMAGKVKR